MSKRIRNILWAAALLACVAVFLFSLSRVLGIWNEDRKSQKLNEDVIKRAVAISTTPETTGTLPEETEGTPAVYAPIAVDFDQLLQENPDVVAWLYCADTPVNYPVVQSSDNEYYLHRLLDGSYNSAGTLFMDYRNQADFSDFNTVIYGHNMKNDTMFGTLVEYKEQAYYDEHPILYLLTPDHSYQVELVAGYVTPSDSDVYELPLTETEKIRFLADAVERSTFVSDAETPVEARYLTLSTCSYEYENARYVLIGRLVEIAVRQG